MTFYIGKACNIFSQSKSANNYQYISDISMHIVSFKVAKIISTNKNNYLFSKFLFDR